MFLLFTTFQYNIEKKLNTEDEMSEDDDDFGGGAKKEEDDDPAARKYCAQWKNSNFRNFCWMIRTQSIFLLKLFLL